MPKGRTKEEHSNIVLVNECNEEKNHANNRSSSSSIGGRGRRKAFVPVERKFKLSFTGISSISRHLTGPPMLGRRNQHTREPQKSPPGGAATTKIKKEEDEEQYHYFCETEIAATKIEEEDEEPYIVIWNRNRSQGGRALSCRIPTRGLTSWIRSSQLLSPESWGIQKCSMR